MFTFVMMCYKCRDVFGETAADKGLTSIEADRCPSIFRYNVSPLCYWCKGFFLILDSTRTWGHIHVLCPKPGTELSAVPWGMFSSWLNRGVTYRQAFLMNPEYHSSCNTISQITALILSYICFICRAHDWKSYSLSYIPVSHCTFLISGLYLFIGSCLMFDIIRTI